MDKKDFIMQIKGTMFVLFDYDLNLSRLKWD